MSTIKVDTINTRTGSGDITFSRPIVADISSVTGTLPMARLSGTLPALNGSALTALNATQLTSGTIPIARIADDAITTAKIAPDAITAAEIGDNVINSEHYAAASIDLEHMSSQSVDEDNLHISNAGTNGQFLSKQSGNTGGLTWADAGVTGLTNNSNTTWMTVSSDEEVTMPLQPFVELRQNSQVSNVTGNGTTYAIAWDTETFDVGSNYASNTFTAPVAGHYLVSGAVYLSGMTTAADTIQYNIIFTNRSYCCWTENVNDLDNSRSVQVSVVGQMDAGDTITQTCRVNGEGSNVVDFMTSGGEQSWFTATLLN